MFEKIEQYNFDNMEYNTNSSKLTHRIYSKIPNANKIQSIEDKVQNLIQKYDILKQAKCNLVKYNKRCYTIRRTLTLNNINLKDISMEDIKSIKNSDTQICLNSNTYNIFIIKLYCILTIMSTIALNFNGQDVLMNLITMSCIMFFVMIPLNAIIYEVLKKKNWVETYSDIEMTFTTSLSKYEMREIERYYDCELPLIHRNDISGEYRTWIAKYYAKGIPKIYINAQEYVGGTGMYNRVDFTMQIDTLNEKTLLKGLKQFDNDLNNIKQMAKLKCIR